MTINSKTEVAIKNRQSKETYNIGYTRRRQTTQKHNTICVGHHFMQTNTNEVNKTRALLQTTEGKDESNIVFMRILNSRCDACFVGLFVLA